MIDINKKYRTRDGREVRLYAVDVEDEDYQVHGAIRNGSGWLIASWKANGGYVGGGTEDGYDLIEVRPRIMREAWANVYPDSISGSFHRSREDAYKYRFDGCLACVKVVIDCEEGEGL